MNKHAIAIFVKTPGLSPVKTRLASTIGEDKALEFYRLSVSAVQETVQHVEAVLYWAIAEEDGLHHKQWDVDGFEKLHTGPGDLGQRQYNIYSILREKHKNVMLLGADCPQLTSNILNEAFAQLDHHNVVIGPASDGGYTLLAGNINIPQDVWTSVKYSRPDTRKSLCDALPSSIHELNMFTDVDEYKDLEKMLQEIPKNPSLRQRALIDWSKEKPKCISN